MLRGRRRKERARDDLLKLLVAFRSRIEPDARDEDGWSQLDREDFRDYLSRIESVVRDAGLGAEDVAPGGDYLGLARSLNNDGIVGGFAPELAARIDASWERWYRAIM